MTIYNLEKKDLIEYPFPIIIQDNFLEQSFFNNLSKSFPNEIFENCSYSEGDRHMSPEIKEVSDSILSGHLLKIVSKYLTLE